MTRYRSPDRLRPAEIAIDAVAGNQLTEDDQSIFPPPARISLLALACVVACSWSPVNASYVWSGVSTANAIVLNPFSENVKTGLHAHAQNSDAHGHYANAQIDISEDGSGYSYTIENHGLYFAGLNVTMTGTWVGATKKLNWETLFGTGSTTVHAGSTTTVSVHLNKYNGDPSASDVVMYWDDFELKPGSSGNPKTPDWGDQDCADTSSCIFVPDGTGDVSVDEGASVANDTTGAYLTSYPVKDTTQPVYYGANSTATPNHYSPTAYFFGSETSLAFTSFSTPNGIAGNTTNIVIDDGTTLTPYTPGTTFTFAQPTLAFAIRGLDSSAMPPDSDAAPFVWTATYNRTGAAIVYEAAYPVPTAPGDFNRDGYIDAADYLVWRKTGGSPQDYQDWRAHFGQTASGSGDALANTSVPEPNSLALLLAAFLFLVSPPLRAWPTSFRCAARY